MAETAGCRSGRQLQDQRFAEQFVVWAVRSWVSGLKTGAAKSFALQRGFDIAGIPEGLHALDRLLGTIATGAARTIDIRCVHCKELSDDERAVLAAVAECQGGATSPARAVFGCLLVPAAARIATVQAAEFAGALSRAKLFLHRFTAVVPLNAHLTEARQRPETLH